MEPEKTTETKCNYCDSKEDLDFRADPYQQEINGDDTPMWICDACHDAARGAI